LWSFYSNALLSGFIDMSENATHEFPTPLLNFHLAARVLKLSAEQSGIDCNDSDSIDDARKIVADLIRCSLGAHIPSTDHCCEHFAFAAAKIPCLRPSPMMAYALVLADTTPLEKAVGPLLIRKIKAWVSLLLQIPTSSNLEVSDAELIGDLIRENLEIRHELESRKLTDV
jgi:hypothetical protein